MKASQKIVENVEKRARGRPRKTGEDIALTKEKTKNLAREVRAALGRSGKLPIKELLNELKKIGFGGEESLWRRYESGSDAMSPNRMFEVAAFAYSKGARGEAVRGALLRPQHDLDHAVNEKNQAQEEAALTGMIEAVKAYLSIVDPLNNISHEKLYLPRMEQFDKMVDLAKEMAWQAYQPQPKWNSATSPIPENYFILGYPEEDDMTKDLADIYNENDGDSFVVRDTLNPFWFTSVPKKPFARKKKA